MAETSWAARGAERLLLLAALLLGLVTMHTLGHGPTGHDASPLARMTAAPAGAPGGASAPASAGHDHSVRARHAEAPAPGPGAGAAHAVTPHGSHPPAHGSGGPLAVCLAVLGALGALGGGLGRAKASRARRAGPPGAGPTGVRWVAWPQPPPALAMPARVAVLRI